MRCRTSPKSSYSALPRRTPSNRRDHAPTSNGSSRYVRHMTGEALPGSGSGKAFGIAATKSVLRLMGGPDLADVIADWTGIGRQTIDGVVNDAANRLRENGHAEFREVKDSGDRSQAELLLIEAFKRAATRQLPAASLRGPDVLAELLLQDEIRDELARPSWTDDQRGYFNALVQTATSLVCRWYLEDQNARGHASALAIGQIQNDMSDARQEQREDRERTDAALSDVKTKLQQLVSPSEFAAHAVAASRNATKDGVTLGAVVADWEAAVLGVHASITVYDETDLTPYIPREHDLQLRAHLWDLREAGARPRLVLVTGNSCSGKTRALYEATLDALPTWSLVAPRTDTDLKRLLAAGVPSNTVVWLDELQDHLSLTADSIAAASAIHALLCADNLGPILFAGTIWPDELDQLMERPPAHSPTYARAIGILLTEAVLVAVPDLFTDADRERARQSDDPRILKAITTAADADHPVHGHKITQVLAGGDQLVARLYPPPGSPSPGAFSPAGRALLLAAAELRRVGHPNPLPQWALEEVAPAYLEPPTARPAFTWLPAAFEQTTTDAGGDDPLTGRQNLDIHGRGVPALTPIRTASNTTDHLVAYNLHDYLTQDHLTRHRHTPTKQGLWDTLVVHADQLIDPRPLAQSAADRGLITAAIELTRAETAPNTRRRGSIPMKRRLSRLLLRRLSPADKMELEALAAAKIPEARQWLLAQRGLDELRASADNGDGEARDKLAQRLSRAPGIEALQELHDRVSNGDRSAREALIQRLSQDSGLEAVNELRALADSGSLSAKSALASALGRIGDAASQRELRSRADRGDEYSLHQLARLGDPDALAQIRSSADSGDARARRRLMGLLGARDDEESLSELRSRADTGEARPRRGRTDAQGDPYAREKLAERLRRVGDPDSVHELRERADAGDRPAQGNLTVLLGQRADSESIDELKRWVHAGIGANALVRAYRRQGHPHLFELTVGAAPALTSPL